MSKYIDAEKLAVLINDYLELPTLNTDYQAGIQKALNMINAYPTADVQEVRHGKNLAGDSSLFECSKCGETCNDTTTWDSDIHYCPNCGAEIDRKENKK